MVLDPKGVAWWKDNVDRACVEMAEQWSEYLGWTIQPEEVRDLVKECFKEAATSRGDHDQIPFIEAV